MTEFTKQYAIIPGASGHEASSEGEIRSIDRVIVRSNGRKQTCRGVVMKLSIDPAGGYPRTTIRMDDGRTTGTGAARAGLR